MGKLIITAGLFLLGLATSQLSILFGILGFLIAKFGGGESDGRRGRIRSIIIPLGEFRLHFHHWIIGLLLMVICWAKGVSPLIPPEAVYGTLGGLVWQGIYCYGDWHRIVYRHADC